MEKKSCDVCHSHMLGTYYDARTIYSYWANMCDKCFGIIGIGLGTGKGQKYCWDDDQHRYIKTGG